MEATYKHPPLVPTNMHPDDIIGREMRRAFIDHFTKWGPDTEGAKEPKGVPADVRSVIAQIYKELQNNGFYPLGLDELGNIRWGVATDLHHELFRDLERPPRTHQEKEDMKNRILSSVIEMEKREVRSEEFDFYADR